MDAGIENDVLAFTVKEYPVIVSIEVEGNDQIKDEDILESIGMKRFDILNTRILKTSIDRIIALYREKGYYNVEVDSSTKATEGGIALVFTVEENNRLYVKRFRSTGTRTSLTASSGGHGNQEPLGPGALRTFRLLSRRIA